MKFRTIKPSDAAKMFVAKKTKRNPDFDDLYNKLKKESIACFDIAEVDALKGKSVENATQTVYSHLRNRDAKETGKGVDGKEQHTYTVSILASTDEKTLQVTFTKAGADKK